MVEFSSGHKEGYDELKAGSNGKRTIQWFKDDKMVEIDLSQIETGDLYILSNEINTFCAHQQSIISDELNDWTTIYCAICGEEDLAHRGSPFITWGIRAGYILCPRHLRAYDLKGTPEGDQLEAEKKRIREEQKEISELFG